MPERLMTLPEVARRLYGRRLTDDERAGLTPSRLVEVQKRSGYYYLDAQGGVRVEYYYRA